MRSEVARKEGRQSGRSDAHEGCGHQGVQTAAVLEVDRVSRALKDQDGRDREGLTRGVGGQEVGDQAEDREADDRKDGQAAAVEVEAGGRIGYVHSHDDLRDDSGRDHRTSREEVGRAGSARRVAALRKTAHPIEGRANPSDCEGHGGRDHRPCREVLRNLSSESANHQDTCPGLE